MRDQNGFTLIELIVSLVLLGIIGTMAGFGLASGMEAYFFSRNNAETMHKAQFALNRIRLELIHMDSVNATSDDSITYTNTTRDPQATCIIARSGDQITLTVGGQDPSLLVDQIGAYDSGDLFTFTDNSGADWTLSDDFKTLHTIGIHLVMARPDLSEDLEFQTEVNPRGNGARNAPKAIRHDL